MDSKAQVEKDLVSFGFLNSKDSLLNKKEVIKRYHKLAKLNHPDKYKGSDEVEKEKLNEAFKEILNIYNRITDYMDENTHRDTVDEYPEEDCVKKFFTNNNFPNQKKSSTVVILQNQYSEEWDSVFQEIFGEGRPLPNGVTGRIFKTGIFTITLYVKPKSDGKTKVHIQGANVDSQLDFIFGEMPKIYQKVCQNAKTKSIDSRECDTCDFNSSSISVLRTHIQDKHILTGK